MGEQIANSRLLLESSIQPQRNILSSSDMLVQGQSSEHQVYYYIVGLPMDDDDFIDMIELLFTDESYSRYETPTTYNATPAA